MPKDEKNSFNMLSQPVEAMNAAIFTATDDYTFPAYSASVALDPRLRSETAQRIEELARGVTPETLAQWNPSYYYQNRTARVMSQRLLTHTMSRDLTVDDTAGFAGITVDLAGKGYSSSTMVPPTSDPELTAAIQLLLNAIVSALAKALLARWGKQLNWE